MLLGVDSRLILEAPIFCAVQFPSLGPAAAMEAFFSPSLALVDELAPDNGDVVSLVSFIDTFALSNEDFCISD